MNKRPWYKLLLPVFFAAFLLLLWELGVRLSGTPVYILPAPSRVLSAFCKTFPTLLAHGGITLGETCIGLLIAVALALLIAVWMDAAPLFHSAVYPLLVVTQTVPVIVLAPIFIIYLGFGMTPKVLIVVLMCFFPVTVSFADGMAQLDPRRIDLLRAMGAPRWKVYTLVKIPGALPSLFSGLKVAATYSISGAVVGEWLSSNAGLGYYMLRVKNGYMLDQVFACVLMIVLLSLLMNALVCLLATWMIRPNLKKRRTL